MNLDCGRLVFRSPLIVIASQDEIKPRITFLFADIFLPSPSDLLVNLQQNRGLVIQLLEELPKMFEDSHATESALGAALQAAYKLASPTGKHLLLYILVGIRNPTRQGPTTESGRPNK